MPTASFDRIMTLFVEARDVRPSERKAFLREHCADPTIREEVASLLDAREQAGGFFDALAEEALPSLLPEGEEADEAPSVDALDLEGRRLGPYRLDEEIGAGGMSVVYRAERVAGDFEQTVAVKLLRPLLSAADAADRFRAERQVLASLDHPNIARPIDGGVTEGGRPYLVMEHVNGVPLTEYAERHDLDLKARLDLLGQVFEAVRAAHRQLVVHRDLKPSNVLVTAVDGEPRVKLLDFGIAKLLDDALPVTRLETRTGQRLMTPAYAAPEQVSGAEVTTATDVYQLGVLAHELLAGARPFDLTGKSLTEIERTLLEKEPAKPSARAETGADQLRGDLDTIILKALRKDPERRYRSVEALAEDLRRHRQGEPLRARPATLGYRAKKFVTRNRTAVGAGVLILLLGLAYAVTVTVQANRLAEQRDRAQREAETTEEVTSYLIDLFRAGNPMIPKKDPPSAEDLLRRGIERSDRLTDQPLIRAKILSALGQAAGGLGRWSVADSLHQRGLALRRKHLDPPHPDLVASLLHLGSLQRRETNYGRALPYFEEALSMSRQLQDPQYRPDLLTGLAHSLAETGSPDSAAVLMRRAIELRNRGSGSEWTKSPLDQTNLARILQEAGHYETAERLFQNGLTQLRSDTSSYSLGQRAKVHSNFAYLLNQKGDYDKAERYARKAVPLNARAHGPEHYTTRRARTHLYAALVQQGAYEQALSIRGKQLELAKDQFNSPHYRLAHQHMMLGRLLDNIGQSEDALSHLSRGVEMMAADAGPENLWTHNTRIPYALCLVEHGQYEKAERLLDRVEPVVDRTHPDSTSLNIPRMKATVAIGRGELQLHRTNWAPAESLLTRGYRSLRGDKVEWRAPLPQRALQHLVDVHERLGQPGRAATYRDSLLRR